jgi:hypothetical protein
MRGTKGVNRMQIYIITFNSQKDKVVRTALHWIGNHELPKLIEVEKGSKIVSTDITSPVDMWPNPEDGCALYLISHGNSHGILGGNGSLYKDPNAFLASHQRLKAVYEKASKVVLVSCSNADEAGLLLSSGGKMGFQAATFATNLKNVDKKKNVVAAVGPVIMKNENDEQGGMKVQIPGGIGAVYVSTQGWTQIN